MPYFHAKPKLGLGFPESPSFAEAVRDVDVIRTTLRSKSSLCSVGPDDGEWPDGLTCPKAIEGRREPPTRNRMNVGLLAGEIVDTCQSDRCTGLSTPRLSGRFLGMCWKCGNHGENLIRGKKSSRCQSNRSVRRQTNLKQRSRTLSFRETRGAQMVLILRQ